MSIELKQTTFEKIIDDMGEFTVESRDELKSCLESFLFELIDKGYCIASTEQMQDILDSVEYADAELNNDDTRRTVQLVKRLMGNE